MNICKRKRLENKMERKIQIFVSGSTDANISKEYRQAAEDFGRMLDIKKHQLVFDGCKGLPGVVASQMQQPNDNLSIATTSNYPIPKWPLAKIRVFRDQSEVTRTLLSWSDIAVFFKGGSGTLTELFHAIDTKKNGEHNKPILILNIQNQWDELIKLLATMRLSHLYHIMATPQEIMAFIDENVKLNSTSVTICHEKTSDDYER